MMQKNKKLSDLPLNELIAERKKQRGTLSALGIAMIVTCGILIYLAIRNKNYALIAVAIACFMTLWSSFTHWGQINNEIKSRESKEQKDM